MKLPDHAEQLLALLPATVSPQPSPRRPAGAGVPPVAAPATSDAVVAELARGATAEEVG